MRASLLLVLALVGCLDAATKCPSGRVCASGWQCDEANGGCALPEQLDACRDRADGDECIARGVAGICHSGTCLSSACGDGFVSYLEECDGETLGDAQSCRDLGFYTAGMLTCSNRCTYDVTACGERCGDGVKNAGEACDGNDFGGLDCALLGYYAPAGLACSAACTFDTAGCTGLCGDGVRNGTEDCDGADLGGADCTSEGFYDETTLACDPLCRFDTRACTGFCNDTTLDAAEYCDTARPIDSCTDFGFEAGSLTCSNVCTPAFDRCEAIGWKRDSAIADDFWGGWAASPTDVYAGTTRVIYHWDGLSWSPTTIPNLGRVVAMWGTDANNVFAIDDSSKMFRWSGTAWSQLPGATSHARGASARTADDIWTAGFSGAVAHWDGTTVTTLNVPGTHRGVAALAPTDVVVVGDRVTRWDGTSWTVVVPYADMHMGNLQWAWGSGSNDVHASGDNGMLAHWDGSTWSLVGLGTWSTLFNVTGTGPDDVYVVGSPGAGYAEQVIYHFDGRAWHVFSLVQPGAIYAVWCAPGGETFAGGSGEVSRGHGNAWILNSTPTPMDMDGIGGTGPDEVFAFGDSGVVLRYDGAMWRRTTVPTFGEINAVSKRFLTGWDGLVLRWDGARWQRIPFPTTEDINRVESTRLDEAFVWSSFVNNVHHWDGSTWADIPRPPGWSSVTMWAGTRTDAWAVHGTSEVAHWDGAAWTLSTVGSGSWNDFWWESGSSIWVSGGVQTARWDGASWSSLPDHPGSAVDIRAASLNDVTVALGGAGYIHWDGTSWQQTFAAAGLSAEWVASSTRVFGVGSELLISHGEGTRWYSDLAPPTNVTRGWMSESDDVYAIGYAGGSAIWHFNGILWSRVTVPVVASDVWGSTANDVFLVGASGTIVHWNGATWTSQPTPTTNALDAVGGTSPTDAWAVGAAGTILRWDGTTWLQVPSPTTQRLVDVFAISPTDAYAVGTNTIVHWNGTAWSTVSAPSVSLRAVWGSGGNDVFVAGMGGTIQHWNGTTWAATAIPDEISTAWTITALWGTGATDVFAAATNGSTHEFMHWDGVEWTPIADPPSTDFQTVFGAGRTVYVGAGLHRRSIW